MFCYQNAGQNCKATRANRSVRYMARLNHCGRSLKGQKLWAEIFGECLLISRLYIWCLHFAIQGRKYWDKEKKNLAFFFVWVWQVVSGIEISIYRVYQNNLTNIKIEFFTENKIITCSQIDLMYNTQVLLNSIMKIFYLWWHLKS